MKKLTVGLFFLILSFNGFSQTRGDLSLTMGAPIPTGDFSSSDGDNTSAGFANTGFYYAFSFKHLISKKFGVAILLRGQANPVDAQAMADYLARLTPGYGVTVESTPWASGSFSAGVYMSFPLTEKLYIEPKFLFGYINASTPKITATLSDGFSTGQAVSQSKSSGSLSVLFGVNWKYDLSKRFALFADIDYLYSDPEFVNVVTTNNSGDQFVDTYNQKMGTFNLGIGIGYNFFR